MTNHPERPWKIHSELIQDVPLTFNKNHLVESLQGCTALVQTYWVRFDNTLGNDRETVTNNSKLLIDSAKEAGLEKVVFLNKDFSERSENSFPQDGIANGISLVETALIEHSSSGML